MKLTKLAADNAEPFFGASEECEAGFEWENYVFGGRCDAINNDLDCKYGLVAYIQIVC